MKPCDCKTEPSMLNDKQKELAAKALRQVMPSLRVTSAWWTHAIQDYQRELARVGLAIQPNDMRNLALEEAAKLCDLMAGEMFNDGKTFHFCAEKIRELKIK